MGTKGKIVLEEGKLRHWIVEGDEADYRKNAPETSPKLPVAYVEIPAGPSEDGHKLILKNFANAILSGEELIAPGPEGVNELSLSNAAYLSAWKGGTSIRLPLSEEDRAEFDRLLSERKAKSKYKDTGSTGASDGEYLSRWSVQW